MSKFRILCLAAACALSASAASPMKKSHSSVSGWGVGLTTDGSEGALQIDYKGSDHEMGWYFNADMFDSNGGAQRLVAGSSPDKNWNQALVGFFVGAREMLKPHLALSGGFEASTLLVDQWSNFENGDFPLKSTPYRVGFYTQLSYEHTTSVATWIRTMLVSYTEDGLPHTANVTSLLSNSRVGISYYFQK